MNPAQPQERKRLVSTRDCVLAMVASPDGKLLACGGADTQVRCFELPSGKLKWQTEPHADWIMGMAFSPDSQHIATASRDRNGDGKKDTTLKQNGRTEVLALGFLDAETPLAALGNGAVVSVDPKSRRSKDKITRYEDRVNVLLLQRIDKLTHIITGCHDGKVRFSEVGKPEPVLQFVPSPGW